MDQVKPKNSIWYWVTALMVFLMMFTCTLTSSGFSVMVNAVKVYAELDGMASSLVFTIKNLSCLCFVFFADKYYKKVGLRFGVFGAFLLGALAMAIFMIADKNIILIYLAAIVAGATYAFGMLLPMALIIHAWFNKMRAFAMSIASAGTGINAMIVTPFLQNLVNTQGTAAAFQFEIFMFLVVGIVFVLLVRGTPEERGLEPYGGANYAMAAAKGKGSGVRIDPKWTILFIVCAAMMGYAAGPTQQYFILDFNQLGYDSMLVAAAYGLLGGMLVVFKLTFGTLSTKFNFGLISCIFLGFYVLSCAFAVGAEFVFSPVMPYGACICLGVAGAVTSLGYPNWIADSSRDDYAKNVKNAQTAYQGFEILGSFVPGLVLDLTGHYTGAYMINGVLFAIVLVVVARAYLSARKSSALIPAGEDGQDIAPTVREA